MPKPSMFSKDYEKLMKRRRVNSILVILIILSAAFFGIKYYLHDNNISFFDNISKRIESIKKDNTKKPTPEPTVQPTPEPTKEPDKPQESFYEYTSSNGNGEIYKVVYETAAEGIVFTEVQSSYADLGYDISQDKQYIVFEDRAASDIVLMSSDGKTKRISPDSYNSKSTGIVIKKNDMLAKDVSYVWAARPHFTSDNRIVYLTDLPYMYSDGKLYMWTASMSGGMGSMIGNFETQDVAAIKYQGYNEEGSLIISVNGKNYYYKKNGSGLSH